MIVAFGTEFKSMSELCRAHGILRTSVLWHQKNTRRSLEQIIKYLKLKPSTAKIPQLKPKTGVVVFGKKYPSEQAAILAQGLYPSGVRRRMSYYGFTLEQAIRSIKDDAAAQLHPLSPQHLIYLDKSH